MVDRGYRAEVLVCLQGESLIAIAKALKSEHGDNPEYDRALVELATDLLGVPMSEKEDVAHLLGITLLMEGGIGE